MQAPALASETAERIHKGVDPVLGLVFVDSNERNVCLATEKFSEYLHVLVNEPSVGLFRVREHVGRSVPLLVERKVYCSIFVSLPFRNVRLVNQTEMRALLEDIEKSSYDVDYCRVTVNSLLDLSPVFSQIVASSVRALELATALKERSVWISKLTYIVNHTDCSHRERGGRPSILSPSVSIPTPPPPPESASTPMPPPPLPVPVAVAPTSPAAVEPTVTAQPAIVPVDEPVSPPAPAEEEATPLVVSEPQSELPINEPAADQAQALPAVDAPAVVSAPVTPEPVTEPAAADAIAASAMDLPIAAVDTVPLAAAEMSVDESAPALDAAEPTGAVAAVDAGADEAAAAAAAEAELATKLSMVVTQSKRRSGKKKTKELQLKHFD
jgi:hypothetical protein